MSKVLFCYDGPLSKDERGNYYGSALNNSVFSKYYYFGDEINIAIRTKKVLKEEANQRLSIISSEYNIIELPNIKTIKGLFQIKKFNEIIKKGIIESDFIIIRMPSSAGNCAIKYCKKYNKKYIVEMVGCVFDSLWNYGLKGKLIAPFCFLRTKRSLMKASAVIYVTEQFLQKRYTNHERNIGISDVVLNDFDERILNERINKIENINKNDKIILGTCAALNVKYKGQEYVIRAIGKLKDKGFNNIEYQLVGGGSSDRLLKIARENNVLDNIKIIGSLPHDKIFNWLDSIDIYIQPSNQEGLCRALLEAMSRALPCIASSAGGNPELINGDYIFKKKKVNKLCDCFVQLLNNMDKEARKNFTKAKEYNKDKLDKKRKQFYRMAGGIGEQKN